MREMGVDTYACGMSVVNGGSVEEDVCVCLRATQPIHATH